MQKPALTLCEISKPWLVTTPNNKCGLTLPTNIGTVTDSDLTVRNNGFTVTTVNLFLATIDDSGNAHLWIRWENVYSQSWSDEATLEGKYKAITLGSNRYDESQSIGVYLLNQQSQVERYYVSYSEPSSPGSKGKLAFSKRQETLTGTYKDISANNYYLYALNETGAPSAWELNGTGSYNLKLNDQSSRVEGVSKPLQSLGTGRTAVDATGKARLWIQKSSGKYADWSWIDGGDSPLLFQADYYRAASSESTDTKAGNYLMLLTKQGNPRFIYRTDLGRWKLWDDAYSAVYSGEYHNVSTSSIYESTFIYALFENGAPSRPVSLSSMPSTGNSRLVDSLLAMLALVFIGVGVMLGRGCRC